MAKETADDTKPAVKAKPAYIKLDSEFPGHYRKGRVLKATDDLIAALDAAKVKYREATEQDRRYGGCTD